MELEPEKKTVQIGIPAMHTFWFAVEVEPGEDPKQKLKEHFATGAHADTIEQRGAEEEPDIDFEVPMDAWIMGDED